MKPATRQSTKPRPAVFLEAARRVGEREALCTYACVALKRSRKRAVVNELAFFEAVLMPTQDSKGVPVESGHPWYDCRWNVEIYDAPTARIFGLVLCSILAREGFQP